MMETPVFASAFKSNQRAACANRKRLRQAGVFTLNVVGAGGSGKTTLVEATAQRLDPHLRSAVIVNNLSPKRDAVRLSKCFHDVVQVASPGLAADQFGAALCELDLEAIDVLVVESTTSPAYPVDFDLGQDVRVGVLSVSGGDDKAAQSPYLVRESDAVVLTKLDLLPYVPFDLESFRSDVHKPNPSAELIELSSLRGVNMEGWIEWLQSHRRDASRLSMEMRQTCTTSEWFVG